MSKLILVVCIVCSIAGCSASRPTRGEPPHVTHGESAVGHDEAAAIADG